MNIEQKKEKVKLKILKCCKKYKLKPPTVWNKKNVQKIADKINNLSKDNCPYCGRFREGGYSIVICSCELNLHYEG